MTTQETAQRTSTKYFIEYVHANDMFYYQLVRTEDLAILYSNENLDNVKLHCWSNNISINDITIW